MKQTEINADPVAAKLLTQCRQMLEAHVGHPVLLTAQPVFHLEDVDAHQFIQDCANEFGLTVQELLKHDRSREVLAARQATVFALYTNSTKGVKEIGAAIGQHHSSVIHSVDKMRSYLYIKDKVALYNLGVIQALIVRKYHGKQQEQIS